MRCRDSFHSGDLPLRGKGDTERHVDAARHGGGALFSVDRSNPSLTHSITDGALAMSVALHQPPATISPPSAPAAAALRYRLASEVPDYWVPFVPVADGGGLSFGCAGLVPPLGRLLDSGLRASGLRVREEEIPREGLELSRRFALARWTNGSTHLWLGRKRGIGTGEASSGLKFDKSE